MTIPTGFVKSTIQASEAECVRTRSAISSTIGTVRSAFPSPPAPVVSCPMHPQASGYRLVREPRRLAADSDLDEHEVRAVERALEVVRHDEIAVEALAGEHPGRHATDDVASLGVDIVERQLGHVDPLAFERQARDELGCVRRASTDDGDLHPFTPVSVMPSTNAFWATKKRAITGNIMSTVAAIVRFHCTW